MTTSNVVDKKRITKKDFVTVYWRSMCHEATFSYERMQSVGFIWTLAPILKRFYGDDEEELKKACIRHTTFFNVTVQIVTFIYGVALALEEKNVNDPEEDLNNLITTAKTALMGPMSAIGDTFYWGTFKIIATGVGCSLCIQGNPLGVLAFILLYNIPNWGIRWYILKLGYRLGENFVESLSTGGVIERLTQAAYIIGLMVCGAMTSSYVSVKTPLVFSVGGSEVIIQEIFDSIYIGILPLCTVLLFAWLMRKKNVKPMPLMISALVICMILGLLGIIG
ncbi:PTS system mannose/fructose/sorbose family transporter subunit IID [Anaerorhabdus sp.]|uniref:PTS system mannose/fructose/sorbose family transporter subunit IID n=1 Tax=Anaerorhabdus sp. TaxID=1872524 RepID=UPI002FC7938D